MDRGKRGHVDGVKHLWKRASTWGGVMAVGLVVWLGAMAPAAADDTILVPTQFADLINSGGDTYLVNGNLTIATGGSILCNGCDIKITVTGDMNMEPGGTISSSSVGSATAGNITITVGNFPGNPPVGVFTMEPGSQVLANSPTGSAGAIVITAGKEMSVDGLVQSFGGLSGVGGNQPPGGGPITLKSGCKLVITPDGKVSSEGKNPGADLVHLQGCVVEINGLVESIATGNGGHALPNNPANHCNNDPVTHTTANNYTACVEVWADTILISSTGQVSADGITSQAQNTRAWIDLIATDSIAINGDNVLPYAVHANAGATTDDFGGLITITAQAGTFSSTGLAVQANALANGGHGGSVLIQAGGNVGLGDSTVEARGGAGSANSTGGTIFGRSFNGVLSGGAASVLNTTSAGSAGSITLQGCGTVAPNDGVSFAGTATPPATILADACGGQPALPPPFTLQVDCAALQCDGQPGTCVKEGTKFRDLDGDGLPREPGEPGLGGWEIRAYTFPGNVLQALATTQADGSYQFSFASTNGVCGTFTFCEVLQPTWTQTFPAPPPSGNVVSCAGIDNTVTLGALGYRETLVDGVVTGNDFGNFQDVTCPKFPNLTADVTIVIDPNKPTQIQDAINALQLDQKLLILPHLGTKTENITINKRVQVIGCSITLTAATVSAPVVTIGASAAKGITTDVHATGSTAAGYKIEGPSHIVKNARSFGNAIGFWITGDGNTVTGALGTTGNNVGFKIDGDGNVVDTASGVTGSNSHGAHITAGASGNTIKKSTFTGNGGEGILVEGTGNIISENKLYSNVLNGINVSGASTQLLKNIAGDKNKGNGLDGILVSAIGGPLTENTARANGKNGIEVTGSGHTLTKNVAGGDAQQANTLCEFVIGPNNLNGANNNGNNKANGQAFVFGNGGVPCVNP